MPFHLYNENEVLLLVTDQFLSVLLKDNNPTKEDDVRKGNKIAHQYKKKKARQNKKKPFKHD